MAISPQWLDELRSRITLSALIGRTVKVTKAGREFKACCPFHNEKTPSFTINDDKGFYHCFGCSAHGDAIRWMTDQRGLSFIDAIKELASEAGMEVPAADPRAAKQAEERAGLHDVMAAAQDYFVQQLYGLAGASAREYLAKRGIRLETILQFGFGFAPDSRTGLRTALKAFGDPMLIEAGLLISVDDKDPYDRFRRRLMIPIRDPRGRVIAFGGRILGDGEPKYLNSPDTPLFDKGRTLYNLDKCAPVSRQTGRVIVVEGYMDVIALAQAGFGDVVAPLGTALTEHQIALLWRLSDQPVICFDGDSAGQKAAVRAASRALPNLTPGKSLKFARLPSGEDPDDFINTHGAGKFGSVISSASSTADFLWDREYSSLENVIKPGPDERAALLDRLEKYAETIQSPQISKEYLRTLRASFYEKFGFQNERVKRLARLISDTLQSKNTDRTYKIHRAVLLGLSRYPAVIQKRLEGVTQLPIIDQLLEEMRKILIEAAVEQPDVEQDIIEQYWATTLHPRFKARDLQTDLAFSFYKRHLDRRKPEADLELVISALVQEKRLEQELKQSLAEMNESYEHESFTKLTKTYEDVRGAKAALRQQMDSLINDSGDAPLRLTGT